MEKLAKPLAGKIALVAGATRASGRGIAIELGAAGATVYCTGKSMRGETRNGDRPETIDETAEMVSAQGGHGVPIKVDHTDENQVIKLFERIAKDCSGKLDVVVNVGSSGGHPAEFESWGRGLPFWETNLQGGLSMLRGVSAHIVTNRYALPLMTSCNSGLIIGVGDGVSYEYRGTHHGMFFYSLSKINIIHIAQAIAADCHHKRLSGITSIALTPGFLRSEEILPTAHGAATEEEWQAKRRQKEIDEGLPAFSDAGCESTRYIGRAIVALATDPNVNSKSGKALSTGQLMKEYHFTDIDGRQPFWDWDKPH